MYKLRGTLFLASLFPSSSSFLPQSSVTFTASSEAQLQLRLLILYICQVWVLQHSRSSSFIQFPRCALSLLSLALLTWLLCDNSCWKAFRRARAIRFPSQLSPCPSAPSTALLPGRGWCLPWGLSTKHPGKADFYNSLNSQRVGLPSIYFTSYPASKGSSICRQYLAVPDKLHLYRLIQTQAINTRRLCLFQDWLSSRLSEGSPRDPRAPAGLCSDQAVLGRGLRDVIRFVRVLPQQWCWPLGLSMLYLAGLSAVI